MATSGITSYSINELGIIEAAMSDIGVLEEGQSIDADIIRRCRRKLNMIVKQWAAQADFAPGLKMWTRRRGFLFLSDAVEYDIGPTGDDCAAEEYVTTTVSVSPVGSVVEVADGSGMTQDMRIGVELDTGEIQWADITTVAGGVVTCGSILGVAAVGNTVFAYLSKPQRPFDILSASLRDQDGQDTFIDVNLSVDEYEQIPNKNLAGSPSRLYFEARRTGARFYLDRAPDDLSKVVRFVYHSYVEDLTSQSDSVDFPPEWFRPLSAQLAMDIAPGFGRQVTPELKTMRDEALRMAQNAHPAKSIAHYVPESDSYD